ncbi:MAG: NUDIX hydrolase [Actinomycetota bacterium]|jgi:8-oxo-dGTP pyrophosphatase MutT (NUDIX family)
MDGPEEPTDPAPQRSEQDPKPPRRRRRRRKPRAGGQAKASTAKAAQTPVPAAAAKPKAASGRKRSRQRKKKGAAAKKGAQRGPKIPTTKEVSAGGVVYRRTDDGLEVVLASRRTRRGQLAWGLAKGGIEIGETREQAAIREVREETGLTADIEADLGDTKYMYVWDDIRIRKTVHFFLMRHTGGNVEDRDDEMEEIRWFPMERAIKRAAYRGERDMLVKAAELLR